MMVLMFLKKLLISQIVHTVNPLITHNITLAYIKFKAVIKHSLFYDQVSQYTHLAMF